ncbi:hypothetical protein sos41_39880 [Alphaproteobacteria bacterium SO-S41]|nr:hypothetical protein sos41_39880 [Alphaproteobacteria bacterium SO-S41]
MADDTDTDNFDIVTANPAAYYAGPADVFNDPELTKDQKLRLLEEWETDLKQRLTSDSEGMAPAGGQLDGEHKADKDAAMLRQATNYLRQVRGDEKGEPFPAAPKAVLGRIWHKIFGPRQQTVAA